MVVLSLANPFVLWDAGFQLSVTATLGMMLYVPRLTTWVTALLERLMSRDLAERRVWPAIDISLSGTRREELLHDEETLNAVTMLRRTLNTMHPVEAMEQLTKQLGRFKSNKEFIRLISAAKVLD